MATLPKRIVKETERLMAEPSVLSTLSAFYHGAERLQLNFDCILIQ